MLQSVCIMEGLKLENIIYLFDLIFVHSRGL